MNKRGIVCRERKKQSVSWARCFETEFWTYQYIPFKSDFWLWLKLVRTSAPRVIILFPCKGINILHMPSDFESHPEILWDSAAATAAQSLQSCPTLCDPVDGSPPGSPIPGILQARALEWVAISFSSAWKWKGKVKSLSRVRRFTTPWTAAHQALPSMGFSRQEYWSGVPLPSPIVSARKTWIWLLCLTVCLTLDKLLSLKLFPQV